MKSRVFCGIVAALFLTTATLQGDEAEISLKGVKCAMNLKAPAKDIAGSSLEFNGGKVFFCCANCPKAFAKGLQDDAKKDQLTAQGNWQLVATKQAKSTGKCPLTGRSLNTAQKTSINGVDVCFCCGNCKGKVAKQSDVKQQVAMVFNAKAFAKGFKVPKAEK